MSEVYDGCRFCGIATAATELDVVLRRITVFMV